ncbi:MAG: small multi-drug export protein [Bacteroidia bacterium]|nr:small multi-drug export protein [Bacteroidia bacterium]MBP9688048.1 small multi-drug export protein [Bacteroidia bacterium]
MEEILAKYITVILTSAFKYIVGVTSAIGLKLNFIETMLCSVLGGMLGVIVYLYLWNGIIFLFHKIWPPKPKQHKPVGKHRRKILKFIIKYEIVGIAILTPILLSVPVGTILAATFEPNKWKIKLYMFISFVAWSLIAYASFVVYGIIIKSML